MKNLVFLLFSVLSVPAFTQQEFTTTGKVTDALSKLPLNGASVFCQNTTKGTMTNTDGVFNMQLPNGGYDLVISYTGYETQVVRISTAEAINMNIELKQKDKSLEEVAVVGTNEVADGLAKYGSFFINNFIGTTGNASKCKIQNPEALHFYFSKKRNRLKVKASDALIIVNDALGYTIKYQLDSFAHEYNSNVSVYTGFPFFEELTGTVEQQATWKQNREKAYKGSRLHFIRSWYERNLEKDGFVIEQVDTNSARLKTTLVENPYDTAMFRESENKDAEVNYNGKLRIIYKKALPDSTYLSESKLPAYLKSQITILEINDGFVIQQNGYFYDQNDVTNIGYWSWKKMAEALPYDYKPE